MQLRSEYTVNFLLKDLMTAYRCSLDCVIKEWSDLRVGALGEDFRTVKSDEMRVLKAKRALDNPSLILLRSP